MVAAPATTIADRLVRARQARFVGRRRVLALFDGALRAAEAAFAVLYVHGPGGVGKTALLHAFTDRAEAAGAPPLFLDGRQVEPTPESFLTACRPLLAPERDVRPVLLVDNYERLHPIDTWLRQTLVPDLPVQAIVVIAGRTPPSKGWRADPGWTDLMQVVGLDNLGAADARSYLAAAGIDAALHDEIVDISAGHPLALSLVVDVLRQRAAGPDLALFHAPDVVRLLLDHFVEDLPTPEHRVALDTCALARATTHRQLRATVGREEVDDLFDWLRQLSFVREGSRGLVPHDLARDVLAADVRRRDTGRYRHLMRVLLRVVGDELWGGEPGEPSHHALLDLLFSFRSLADLSRSWDFGALGDRHPETVRPADRAVVLDLIRADAGDETAAQAARWLDTQPQAFRLDRRADGSVDSVVGWLDLTAADPGDVAADPATRLMWAHAEARRPPAAGEVVTALRFLSPTRDPADRRRTVALVAYEWLRQALREPRRGWDLVSLPDPSWWTSLLGFGGYEPVGALDGGHHGLYARDWRVWPEMLARFLDENGWPRRRRDQPAGAARLSRPAFEAAVRQALRDLHRPLALARNPLTTTALVAGASGDEAGERLGDLLTAAARSLAGHPRDEKLFRALDRTYFRPAPTQEIAAELLGLPSSTYRRHLAQGISRVVADLWEQATTGLSR